MSLKSLVYIVSLVAVVTAATTRRVKCPDGKNTASNAKCCAFFALRDDLLDDFGHTCSEDVHETLRLAFHDAIGFSRSQGPSAGGGADGSFLLFPDDESNRHENNGTHETVEFLQPILANHNVSAGDLIQFSAAVGTTLCPGAPRLQFFAGRANAKAAAIEGLIPQPEDSVSKILSRMEDGGNFSPDEVVALLASHSIARADHVDPELMMLPFDTTPFTFDTQFFLETLLKGTGFPGAPNVTGEAESPLPEESELRLQSDFSLARDPRTACTWQSFIGNQKLMQNKFADAMLKLSLIGHKQSDLIDCSEVVPQADTASFEGAHYPASQTRADVEQACKQRPFPSLPTNKGKATQIPKCPDGSDSCDGPGSS